MKRPALAIGLFILGFFVLTVVAVLWVGGSNLFSRQVEAVVFFQDGVAGLYNGAPVTFRGVPVGQVVSIGLELDTRRLTARIPVGIRLSRGVIRYEDQPGSPPSLEALVRRGLRAKLIEQSLVTGQRAIDLDMVPGALPANWSADDRRPEIPALANRLDAFVNELAGLPLRDIASDLRATLKSTQSALDDSRAVMKTLRSTLDQSGHEIKRVGDDAHATLAAARSAVVILQASSDATLASVRRLAEVAEKTTTEARPELLKTIESGRAAAEEARVAMGRLAALTATDAPLRTDLENAMADAARAARSLRDWSELVEEQPNALVFGRRKP